MPQCIKVGARQSPLSRVQLQEVHQELISFHPHIEFHPHLVMTTGDIDKKTSLRDLGSSDFFTKELDEMVLSGKCQVAIHSAKDLPHPLPKGLSIVALTAGIDPSDSLVLREGEDFYKLPSGATIATSSRRREECVKELRKDLSFVDLRGTIGERLDVLFNRKADGVVIAEAALIRLALTHLNRMKLPGITAQFQGRLAVVAREGDVAMKELFSCIHAA